MPEDQFPTSQLSSQKLINSSRAHQRSVTDVNQSLRIDAKLTLSLGHSGLSGMRQAANGLATDILDDIDGIKSIKFAWNRDSDWHARVLSDSKTECK